jgi:Phosphotransferase enzyme family
MNDHARAIATILDRYELRLERDVFATTDAHLIAALVDRFCRERLGAGVERCDFFASSVGSVHGLRLADGRRVVVKAYRRDIDIAHVTAMQRVQARLAADGFPAPCPMLAPTPLAHGIAIVEALLDRGQWVDAHEPTGRKAVAAGLAQLVARARSLGGAPGLTSWRDAYDGLWRHPHDRRFDFSGTAHGAEWIDRLAAAAGRCLDENDAGDHVIGHGDWRVEHLRFADGELSAVYDWDSLSVGPEPVFAGSAAHAFTADWSIEGHACIPTVDESLAFLADYEAARGAPFSKRERRLARAGLVAAMAYSARCGHSDRLTACGTRPPRRPREPIPPDGILARHGARLLGE